MTRLEELFAARVAMVVRGAIPAERAAEVRARLDRGGYARYALLDRGSYDVREAPGEPALIDALARLAGELTGRAFVPAGARALRLRPGDYLLAHHDQLHDDGPVELMLDLSPARVPGAEVCYRDRGRVFFRVAPEPGALSIVERGPAVACNHAYVSKRHAGAEVVRLVVLLRAASFRHQ